MKVWEKVIGKRVFSVILALMFCICQFGMSDIIGAAKTDVSGNAVSDNDILGAEVSGNDLPDNIVSDDSVSGGDISGNDVSGNEASANDIPGENVSDKTVSGSDISDNNISGDSVSDNDVSANDVSNNDISGCDILSNSISDNSVQLNLNESSVITMDDVIVQNEVQLASVVVDKESSGSLTKTPSRPEFGSGSKNNQKITVEAATKTVKITAESGCTIYYSLDGKNPTYKKGVLSSNAIKYSSAITIGNQSKVVLKAIAVNAAGLCSPVMTHTFMFKPAVSKIVLSAPGSTSSTDTEGVTTISVNLVKGKSLQLNASYTPVFAVNKELEWKIVSSPSNAGNGFKVSSKGKITTSKNTVAGTYKVRAILKSNPKITSLIIVKVVNEATITSLKGKVKTVELTTKGSTGTTYELFPQIDAKTTKTLSAASFVWVSSDKSVATVTNKGVVKTVVGVSGKAIITATAKDGSGLKVTFTIKVYQQATSVKITGSSKLGLGKSTRLTAIVEPMEAAKQKVKWEITQRPTGADTKQVKIDAKGNIKASSKAISGNYTVKATALDGSGKSGTFVVTVQSPIKSVSIDSGNFTLYRVIGSSSINAPVSKAVVVSAETTEGKASMNWEILNSAPGIVTATYSSTTKKVTIKATGKATGTATITCQATDGSKKKDTIKVTVVNPPSSIKIQLPNDSTGDLAMGRTHKLTAIVGSSYGDPGKIKVKWSFVKEVDGLQLNSSTGALKISSSISTGTTFKIKAEIEGGVTLSTSVSCTARTPIKKFELYYEAAAVKGEPIVEYGKQKDIQVRIMQAGSSQSEAGNKSSVTTTKSFAVTANSDDLIISYSNKTLSGTMKSTVPGSYKVTVKALDGTGKKKTYKFRVR